MPAPFPLFFPNTSAPQLSIPSSTPTPPHPNPGVFLEPPLLSLMTTFWISGCVTCASKLPLSCNGLSGTPLAQAIISFLWVTEQGNLSLLLLSVFFLSVLYFQPEWLLLLSPIVPPCILATKLLFPPSFCPYFSLIAVP